MRRSPRSVLAWCAALVVAAVTATVVFSDLATLHRRAGALGKPRSVLIATQDLPLGATVGANDVQTISRHASVIPDDALSSMENAVGRTVAVPVLSGSVLLDPHLADPDRHGLEGLVALGFRAVRVRPEDGLQPPIGAVVDVLAAIDPSVTGRTNAEVVAHGARVLAVDATGGESAAGNTAGVTLLVTEDEARELAFASANGVLTLALAPPEDACCSPPES